jgi:eukaryotic-like serine/threonine-protein kinase
MAPERPSQIGRLSPGAPNDPAPFGQYQLLGLIARGGMAEVYRGRYSDEKPPKRLLAIKVMRQKLAREARFIEMFYREGKLAAMLRNDCIVDTREVGEIDGCHYIAMEYIGGRDLTQVLRRCQETGQRIPIPHAAYIAARIAEGLHFAHTLHDQEGRPLNIVNRDVSPSNVRLGYDGEVKLLDFGIAQAQMKFTNEIGILKGKFSYMSPEQIRGMPLDARTDVFSAGIILHEMLATEKLFRGDTEFALMEKVRKAEVLAPSEFNRRVMPELDAITLRALARDVADRYQTAAQLAADLDSLIAGYRFDPKELRQFVRQLFRNEYAKELEETQTALDQNSTPPTLTTTARMQTLAPQPSLGAAQKGDGAPTKPGGDDDDDDDGDEPTPTPTPQKQTSSRPRSFWGSLFKRKK